MKRLGFTVAAIVLLITSCKKDDGGYTPGTTSSQSGTITPPAGFMFPHTYYQRNKTREFKVWINGIDVSSHFTINDIFKGDQGEEIPDFNITLLDKNFVELHAPTALEIDTVPYFFTKAGFNLIFQDDHYIDTILFANGDYTEFTISFCDYAISGYDQLGNTLKRSGSEQGLMNYKELKEYAKHYSIYDTDTIAYINNSITMK